jgi:arylsulfatase A-like enzyme
MAELITEKHDRPFFATLGIYRPHTRWLAPKRFYDLYPIDEIAAPAGHRAGDPDDLPPAGRWLAEINITPYVQKQLVESGRWREAIQAYQAAVSYADSELGRVLDALDASPNAGNTILVVFSDHGYHLGEKEHWHKMALWERAAKVPLIISFPEQRRAGGSTRTVAQPVSLLDLYPTLLALCGLPPPETHALEGVDLAPALGGRLGWTRRPVVTSYGIGNDTVRDERYRYIRYADGSEELYDHDADPHEWTNLAGRESSRNVIERLAAHLPRERARYGPFDGDRDGRATWLDEGIFGALPMPEERRER